MKNTIHLRYIDTSSNIHQEWDVASQINTDHETYNDTFSQQQKLQYTQAKMLQQSLNESEEVMSVEELRSLFAQKNYNAIKEYAKQNDLFRTSLHEASHVILWKRWSLKSVIIDSVSIGKKNNNDWSLAIQKKIDWISSWRVVWKNFFDFSDKHFIQTLIAWYVFERWLGFSHEIAASHAQQDFQDIVNRPWYEYIYENWWSPSYFNEEGDLVCEEVNPLLTHQQIRDKLITLAYTHLQEVASIITKNRDLTYELWIELFDKKSLDETKINEILAK